MEKHAKELAIAGLEIYSRELSPLYEQHRRELLGELAITNSSLEDLSAKEENDRGNHRLISDFIELLPKTESHFEEFADPDIHKLLSIKDSVVWLSYWYTGNGRFINRRRRFDAYYLVGENHPQKSERKHFLFVAANPHNRDIYSGECPSPRTTLVIKPNKRDLKKLKRGSSLGKVNEDEARRMFNPNDHLFNLGLCTPGINIIHTKQPPVRGISHISDEQLVAFNVFDRLNELATIFGQEESLKALLSK